MNKRFDSFCEKLLRELWVENPVEASFYGIHDYDDRLNSYSTDAIVDYRKRRREYLGYLRALHEKSNQLKPEQVDNLDLLIDKFTVEDFLFGDFEIHTKDPVFYLDIIMDGLFLLTIKEAIPLEERLRNLTGRLFAVPRLLEEAKINLEQGGKDVPPLWVEMAVQHAESGLHFVNRSLPDLASSITDLQNDMEEAICTASESIKSFVHFLENDVAPKAIGDFSVGEDVFKLLLKQRLRLQYTPSDLLKTAENVSREILTEMQDIARDMKGTEDWGSVVEELKDTHPPKKEILSAYTDEISRLRDFIVEHDILTVPEGERLNVVETPSFMKLFIPYAAYLSPGPFEEDLNGHFLVTVPTKTSSDEERLENLKGHNSWAIPITSLHEGYPGHHLQLITSNLKSRGIRKIFGSDLFAEGWALYCEELMGEKGYYSDPRTRLMQLKDLLWRACRVEIDIRLHTRDLDLNGAVDILVNVARLEKSNALAEAKRYSRSPTQPLTYLIGKLEILKLRELLQRKEGKRFDLKSFHDRLLSFGTIPFDIVSRRLIGTDLDR